ncbi:AraC family transcriptional regulator [Saccharopolyspora sp. NPDC047091]|uniref:AraC family transcriptional regulator n=1 Tax=Saccharopolyspora sp. NPDC047091 TaxID=3155924 RepID=UPI0034100A64
MRDEWIRYRRCPEMSLEAMHAFFRDHTYERHSHDAYSFGVTETGAQTFRCRGASRVSAAGMVMAFNPEETHDGHSAIAEGFTYRIVHLGPRVVAEVLADAAGEPGGQRALPLFAEPVLHDPVLARAVRELNRALLEQDSALLRDEALRRTVYAMVRRGSVRAPLIEWEPAVRPIPAGVRAVREHLHAHAAEEVSARHLAEIAGCSRFALHRAFTAAHGLAPGAYQRQLRLREARHALGAGASAAEAAARAGFADQAHLTRWFRRCYGITPGTFRAGS